MNTVILGNIFSLLATGTDVLGSTRKTARGMLWFQTASQVLLGLSSLVLGGYSAVVQNAVSLVRNLTALSNISSKILEYILVVLGVVLGFVFNNLGLVGWLPIIANLEYSLAVFRFKDDDRMLKMAFCVCVVLYTLFNLAISNYVGAAANTVVLITTIIALVRLYANQKKEG